MPPRKKLAFKRKLQLEEFETGVDPVKLTIEQEQEVEVEVEVVPILRY
jgi:hypothetical protein